jgi:hypothetical protein
MRAIIIPFAVLALAACTHPDDADSLAEEALPSLAANQSEPLLALVDHMLGTYFASDVSTRPTICVSTHDGRSDVALPPEDERELMTRYEGLAPLARCAWLDDGWQDSETGEPAMVFNVHNFTCTDESNCTAFGGFVDGSSSSLTYRYAMSYVDGAWKFERDSQIIMDRE